MNKKISNRDIEKLYENGQDAFLASVAKDAKKFGVKYGDFPYDAQSKFDAACEAAVRTWLEVNMNEATEQLDEADFSAQIITDYIWGRKGNTLGDKIINLLFKAGPDGTPAISAATIIKRLKNAGYSDKQIDLIRDVATQSMHAAIEQVRSSKKLSPDDVAVNKDSFGVYQFRFHSVSDSDIKEAMVKAEKLMHMKLQKLQKELSLNESKSIKSFEEYLTEGFAKKTPEDQLKGLY